MIYLLLELVKAISNRSFLKLACRVGDNILETQSEIGPFLRLGYI